MYHYHSHGKSLIYPILIFKSWYWSIVISVISVFQHYKGDLMGYDGNTHEEIYNQCQHNMRVIHKNVANKASFPVKATIFPPMKSWFSRWESWSCSSLSLVKIIMFPVEFHILPVKILIFPGENPSKWPHRAPPGPQPRSGWLQLGRPSKALRKRCSRTSSSRGGGTSPMAGASHEKSHSSIRVDETASQNSWLSQGSNIHGVYQFSLKFIESETIGRC